MKQRVFNRNVAISRPSAIIPRFARPTGWALFARPRYNGGFSCALDACRVPSACHS
tara:strand:+ start:17495 stop:17662 length:168 start_codon:yes stop_codon:yes gene_type:complete